jgi:cytochrome c oxidase cbb3-type subunit 4
MSESTLHSVLAQVWYVWVAILFVGIVWYAYRPRNHKRFEEYGAIPLHDDEEVRHGDG